MNPFKLFLVYIFLLTSSIYSQDPDVFFFLSKDSLDKKGEVSLGKVWKYQPSDNLEWAKPEFNDSIVVTLN